MQYIVLGMHKSGTTLIAKTLHKAGVPMGNFDASVSYDKGNQYEREEALVINNDILHSAKKQSLEISPKEIDPSRAKAIGPLVDRLNKQHKEWGFKDPRTCLTYTLWKPYLWKPKIIIVFRHPRSVAYHYCKTGMKDYIMALKRYVQYNRRIRKIGAAENALFISYDQMISDERELIRLAKFTGKDITNIIDPAMNRSKDKYIIRFWICNLALFFVSFTTPLSIYKKLLKLAS